MADASVSAVITHLRDVLAGLSDEEIEDRVFASIDTDGSGGLRRDELKRALGSLGLRVTSKELDDVMTFFDADGNGTITLDEFLRFKEDCGAAGGTAADTGPAAGIVTRVRGALMALNGDALRKLFVRPGTGGTTGAKERLLDLDESELLAALTSLGVPRLTREDIKVLLLAMDANNDGFVSYDEISDFLGAERFAEGVRLLMSGAARFLRARGSSLERVLRRIARDNAATPAAANNATTIPAPALRRLLADRLGFPLSESQLAAVVAMADLDGSGDCDVAEVLFLAGEEEEEGGGVGAGAADAGDHALGHGGYGGMLRSGYSTDEDADNAALDRFSRGPGDAEKEEAAALSRYCADTGINVITLLDDDDDDEHNDSGDERMGTGDPPTTADRGLSPLEGVPTHAPSHLSLWSRAADAAFDAVATEGSAGTADWSRVGQALTMLGLPTPQTILLATMRRLAPSDAVSTPSPVPNPIARAGFRRLVDTLAASASASPGRAGLPPVAEGRLMRALLFFARGDGNGHIPVLTRVALASALLSVPAACLQGWEAVALAAHAPGTHRDAAIALVQARARKSLETGRGSGLGGGGRGGGGGNDAYDDDFEDDDRSSDEGGVTVVGGGGKASSAQTSARGAARVTFLRKLDGEGGGGGGGAAAATPLLSRCYPSDPRVLAGAGLPNDADVSVPDFVAWIRGLAAGGGVACPPVLCTPTSAAGGVGEGEGEGGKRADDGASSASQGLGGAREPERFPVPVPRAFALLDPAARLAVRKLCSGLVCIPSPWPGRMASPAAAVPFPTSFHALARRLPSCCRPSVLAAACAAHASASLGAHLFDGGFEGDPGNLLLLPPSLTPSAGTPAGAGSPHAGGDASASPGLGLTLRLASLISGSPDDGAGCLPLTRAVPDRSTTLRPIGGAAGPTDIPWASEGEAVRPGGTGAALSGLPSAPGLAAPPASLLTALLQLVSADGIPCPRDDDVRGRVVGRFIRVAIVDAAPAPDEHTPSRVRLLSNAFACPASWDPFAEGSWTMPASVQAAPLAGTGVHASGAASGRVVVRSDQPRERGGPATGAVVLFELTLVLARPLSSSATATAAAAGAAAGGPASAPAPAVAAAPGPPSGDADAAAADPESFVRRLHDPVAFEEVTCAWGSLPLATLAGTSGTHRIPLTGGSPGAQADILPADLPRPNLRRGPTGFSGLVARALSGAPAAGPAGVPTLTLQCVPLSKLKKPERVALGRLPLTVVLPLPWVPLLGACRQLAADLALSTPYSHVASPTFLGASVPAAALRAILALPGGPGANNSAAGVLSRALEIELTRLAAGASAAAAKKQKQQLDAGLAAADAATSLSLRLLPLLALEGEDGDLPSAGGTLAGGAAGSPIDDLVARSLFVSPTVVATDPMQTIATFRTPGAWRPFHASEQLLVAH
jgi:Ca2+-binding EF-hand superfamily protein